MPDRLEKKPKDPVLSGIDFSLLEKLFETGRESAESLEFQNHIKKITHSIASEIGITSSAVDQLKLETLIGEYILYRRFYLKSLHASDATYDGPLMKQHEKLAEATVSWTRAAQKALENFNRLLRELEFKYDLRNGSCSRSYVLVTNPGKLLGLPSYCEKKEVPL